MHFSLAFTLKQTDRRCRQRQTLYINICLPIVYSTPFHARFNEYANSVEANFGKENVLVLFRCSSPPESAAGPARISRKSGKLEVIL